MDNKEQLEILSRTKQALICFNTEADMKSSKKIKEGMCVKTLGKNSINDGQGAEYFYTQGSFVKLNVENNTPAVRVENLTQSEYDALLSKDPNTFYAIIEEGAI